MALTLDIKSPSSGIVRTIKKAAGDGVTAGTDILILEVMKMDVPVKSPADGDISEILVGEGEEVAEDDVLARIKAQEY